MEMSKRQMWIQALRLRTLPLSWAGIVAGAGMAAHEGAFDLKIFLLSLLTASLFQIVSNLANDYGDGVKGTDRKRQGPVRAVQSGIISPAEMKKAIIIASVLSALSALLLLKVAFGHINTAFVIYALLTGAAIWAAIKYTVGRSAYGYAGLGDLFVLLFFGFVSVAGSYFLYTHRLDVNIIFPSLAIGMMSMAVLNLNNMRDLDTDAEAGKRTIPVKIGLHNAFAYHRALLIGAFLMIIYLCIRLECQHIWSYGAALLPLYLWYQSYGLQKQNKPEPYIAMLKKTSLYTLLTAVWLALALAVY